MPPAAAAPPALQTAAAAEPRELPPAASPASPDRSATASPDYRQRLRPTPLGWPVLAHWCLWVEPDTPSGAPDPWQKRWRLALDQALAVWAPAVSFSLVDSPEAAQIRILRRRPPLRFSGGGPARASHGRASLSLALVDRGEGLRLEPQVEVQLSPGQRLEAQEATAIHELGHAFGLWGHSDDPGDAMAATPGAVPVRALSPRDRATLGWLLQQPTRFGLPLSPP
ncbi:MAG: peptidase [Synechococcaceae cyanobacterium]|nr:peptidase [Synechococcaceae cyanobacterium]